MSKLLPSSVSPLCLSYRDCSRLTTRTLLPLFLPYHAYYSWPQFCILVLPLGLGFGSRLLVSSLSVNPPNLASHTRPTLRIPQSPPPLTSHTCLHPSPPTLASTLRLPFFLPTLFSISRLPFALNSRLQLLPPALYFCFGLPLLHPNLASSLRLRLPPPTSYSSSRFLFWLSDLDSRCCPLS